MNDFTSTERTLTENFPIQMISDGSNPFQPTITFRLSSTVEAKILTFGGEIPTFRLLRPEDLPQVGGFITRSTMEDPPPNPLYMELFE